MDQPIVYGVVRVLGFRPPTFEQMGANIRAAQIVMDRIEVGGTAFVS